MEPLEENKKEDELEERLRAHSSHFASMVELIPAKFYIIRDDSEDVQGSKYWVNKKEITNKAKRMKLDPGTQKSVIELQAEAVKEGEEGVSSEGCGEKQLNGFSVEHVQSSSLSDLQERLKEKIESLRKNRKTLPEGGLSGKVLSGKVAGKRQKKEEKRKREKELRKKKLVSSGRQNVANGGKTGGFGEVSNGRQEAEKIVFSKFDFSAPVDAEMQVETKNSKKRDYKKLLAKAEASQRKLDEFKRNDERRGRELEKKLKWQKALDMARGTKLKDDPKLLKKTSKRVEKRKQKSKEKWEEQKASEREAREKLQEKRKRNIQQRRDQVKERKIKKRAKKGGTRKPGF